MQANVQKNDHMLPAALDEAYASACGLIAPTWPLEQMIAVNPLWEMRHQPSAEVAARLSALARARLHMAPGYYAALQDPLIEDRHLMAAAAELGISRNIETLRAEIIEEPSPGHWHNVSDLLDSERDRQHKMAWRDEITQQISQFCAACFQAEEVPTALYERWLETTRADRGIPIVMGEPALRSQFSALPSDRDALLAEASAELSVPEVTAEIYAHALLLDINGWASWIAYLRWQARLAGGDNDLMKDLLAIRMAWDLALWRHLAAGTSAPFRRLKFLWQRQLRSIFALMDAHQYRQRPAQLWQLAAEFAYQEQLTGALLSHGPRRGARDARAAGGVLHRRAFRGHAPASGSAGSGGTDRWLRRVLRHAHRVSARWQRFRAAAAARSACAGAARHGSERQ